MLGRGVRKSAAGRSSAPRARLGLLHAARDGLDDGAEERRSKVKGREAKDGQHAREGEREIEVVRVHEGPPARASRAQRGTGHSTKRCSQETATQSVTPQRAGHEGAEYNGGAGSGRPVADYPRLDLLVCALV